MKTPRILSLAALLIGPLHGRDTAPEAHAQKPAQDFRVLSESTVRLPDGGSVTFKQVEPPPFVPKPKAPAVLEQVEELTLEQLAELQRHASVVLSISASVHDGGFTVLRWTSGDSPRVLAVCNVDFRHLAGLGNLETAVADYFIIMGIGADASPLTAAEARAAKTLPADDWPSFALLDGTQAQAADAQAPLAAMEALLEFYHAHQADLIAKYQQRETEAAARELAARNAPPPPPRQSVIHFWPLQPEQKAEIEAEARLRANPAPAAAGTTEQRREIQHAGGSK